MFLVNEYTLKQRMKDVQEGYKQCQSEQFRWVGKQRNRRSFWKKLLTCVVGRGEKVVVSKGSNRHL
ncbi:hypothetical protein [Neobacillus niacini]|uniref:hypothetical protein n=1 Tax=Neobacillus niacini TaxID=86668 RepID=UPI0021CB0A0D|nr:hypothetical protein [Neobacillus niacini]MCM3766281.1 hypothetical protein [Neobacillus niacini]